MLLLAFLRTPQCAAGKILARFAEGRGIDLADLEHITKSVFEDVKRMVDETMASLSMDEMQRAVDAILAADEIVVIGMGPSGITAQEFIYRLQWIGMSRKQHVDLHRQTRTTSSSPYLTQDGRGML
jgi:DNA-binding MurR/RpiR family transcriptional regulator